MDGYTGLFCSAIWNLFVHFFHSFATLFPPKATSYLLVGAGLSTFFLAGLQLGIGLDQSTENVLVLVEYYLPSCALCILVVIIVLAYISSNSAKEILDIPEGEDLMSDSENDLLLNSSKPNDDNSNNSVGFIFKNTLSCQISIILCTWLQIGSVSLVLFVPNQSPKSYDMSLILLWVNSVAQFFGSELQTFWAPMKRPWVLLIWSFLHFLMFPFIVYYSLSKFWVNNIFTFSYMAVMVLTNSYLISECYRLSTTYLKKADFQTSQLCINIALYVGVYIGMTTVIILFLLFLFIILYLFSLIG